ncbi:ETX/MTX2 family pore-forming toxin [Streptomyces sp. I6]|uniref:ETX/MTX2 family pore-forming toxin n=1 Tax=Streptomyces sp. I6 TaxID=2483113 RepID=UPI001610CF0A|nr:ETX/MTX2 family pore-forming toxin [Streptomyces sp. I6]
MGKNTMKRRIRAVAYPLTASAVVMSVLLATPAQADTLGVTNLENVIKDQVGILTYAKTGKVTNSNTTVTVVGDPSVSLGDLWFVGTSTLKNTTDAPLTMTSESFTKSISDTVTNTVTKGVSVANKVSASVDMGKAVHMGTELTTTWSFSDSNSTSQSQSVSYTAPSQNIVVPAHSTATVTVRLQQAIATGNVDLSTDLGGTFEQWQCSGGACGASNEPLYDTLANIQKTGKTWGGKPAPALPSGFTLNSAKKALSFKGAGTYRATYGANFDVQVSTSPNTASAPAAKSYSLTVPAA